MLAKWYEQRQIEKRERERAPARIIEQADWIAWREKLEAWEKRREEARTAKSAFLRT